MSVAQDIAPSSFTAPPGEAGPSAREEHWQRIFTTKPETGVSWFQAVPDISLAALLGPDFALLDAFEQDHETRWGTRQGFVFTRFRREGAGKRPEEAP